VAGQRQQEYVYKGADEHEFLHICSPFGRQMKLKRPYVGAFHKPIYTLLNVFAKKLMLILRFT
jgi:hypothetical protein